MQNAKFIMQNDNPSRREGMESLPYGAEVQEITSAQVIFPNRKTADEVVAELLKKVDALQAEVDALKGKVVDGDSSTSSE